MEYRIVRRANKYLIQYHCEMLFFDKWVTVNNMAEIPAEFDRIDDARKIIEEWKKKDVVVENVKR